MAELVIGADCKTDKEEITIEDLENYSREMSRMLWLERGGGAGYNELRIHQDQINVFSSNKAREIRTINKGSKFIKNITRHDGGGSH